MRAQFASFGEQEHRDRLARARQLLRERGIEYCISVAPESLYYYGGYDSWVSVNSPQALIFAANGGEPTIVLRDTDLALAYESSWVKDVRSYRLMFDDIPGLIAAVAREKGLRDGKVAVETQSYALPYALGAAIARAVAPAEIVDATTLLGLPRLIKSETELAYLREAAGYAQAGLHAARKTLKPGITEIALAAAVEGAMRSAGSDYWSIPTELASGDRTAGGHATPRERVIQRGELVHLEFAGVARRYHATAIHTLAAGEPNRRSREIYELGRASLAQGIKAIRPGVKVGDVEEASLEPIRAAGLEHAAVMRFGYGIGVAYPPIWLEPLRISRGSDQILEPGMVFVLHAYIQLVEEQLGIIQGGTYALTDHGVEMLVGGGDVELEVRLNMPVEIDVVGSDEKPPSRADVVVVGGGIIGTSTALFLAEQGIRTLLCEKGVIAGEQSSRNWGWCRTMGRDPRELPLALESLKLWREMNERVGAETGFREIGTLYICPDEAAFAKREAWLPHARQHGLDSRLLRGKEVNRLLEGSTERWVGALHTPGDGVAEPRMAAPAIATAARRLGASIMTNCAARGIEKSGGRVSAVMTEKGRVACHAVVLAGGAWSSLFCRQVDLRLPQLKVLASVLRTGPIDGGPSTAAWGPGLALRKRLDGGYTVSHGSVIADIVPDNFRFLAEFLPVLRMEWKGISLKFGKPFFEEWRLSRPWRLDEVSPFERVRMLDPAPVAKDLERARANLEHVFPVFKGVPTAASWGGLIDTTPDVLPVISSVDAIPGFYVSTGYSGHGFGIGPGAGRLTADLVSGSTPVVDPAPFRFSRFTDGSSLKPQAGL